MSSVLRRLLGGVQVPKAKYVRGATRSTIYEGMNPDYRWFRQDELVRRCVVTNAYYSTMHGFETMVDAEDKGKQGFVKKRVDAVNKAVNLDLALFTAQVKRSIYGSAGFEVVTDGEGLPLRLLSLDSARLKPDLDEDWRLTGYTYRGRKGFYAPEEVLYFTNLGLEADHLGLSDLEPLRSVCMARHEVLRENFPEIARTLWAPYVILKADTSGLPLDEAEKTVEQLAEVARAGKSIAINESVEAQMVHLTPDIKGLNELLGKLEEAIIGALGTPRFLLGRPIVNRATAYAELEAYVEGVVSSVQRYLGREVERQWYDRITGVVTGGSEVRVKHIWNPVRATDVNMLADTVAKLWGSHGMGPLGGHLGKAWELMGWDREELEDA
ncbi:MAG: hypothetical protein NWE89_11810 [Candidatus Bathyarchaeota archaeon]|nr:hypothetical protein [Candidatus Bathyarchaeota archaeon]